MNGPSFDLTIIGGGIIGCATAMQLAREHPGLRIGLIEKEDRVAAHQSGTNSGVIHSGIYYRPGSQKAENCVAGVQLLTEFCQEHEIEFDLCGKVIVATSEEQIPRLEELHRRGQANGVPDLEVVDRGRLAEIEPEVRGVKALHSPRTGIIDYKVVTRAYAEEAQQRGAHFALGSPVQAIEQRADLITIRTADSEFTTRQLVNCGGLYADVIAHMMGQRPQVRVLPFRGEYYLLKPESRGLVKGLIYPVPDPRFPFLGPHYTRTIDGEVEAGPNAVLALAKEGYKKTKVNLGEAASAVAYRGFWRMAARYWRTGLTEMNRSFRKSVFTRSLQTLIPGVQESDLGEWRSGVRAQAVSPTGEMVDDFSLIETKNAIHVLNAPSPGATASLAIAGNIASRARSRFDL